MIIWEVKENKFQFDMTTNHEAILSSKLTVATRPGLVRYNLRSTTIGIACGYQIYNI